MDRTVRRIARKILAVEEADPGAPEEAKKDALRKVLTARERQHLLARWLEEVWEDLSWYDNLYDAARTLLARGQARAGRPRPKKPASGPPLA